MKRNIVAIVCVVLLVVTIIGITQSTYLTPWMHGYKLGDVSPLRTLSIKDRAVQLVKAKHQNGRVNFLLLRRGALGIWVLMDEGLMGEDYATIDYEEVDVVVDEAAQTSEMQFTYHRLFTFSKTAKGYTESLYRLPIPWELETDGDICTLNIFSDDPKVHDTIREIGYEDIIQG